MYKRQGFPYEFFFETTHVERLSWRYDLHTPGELVRLDHFNQVTPDEPRAVNFMQTLDAGRIGIAALSLGIAEGAFEQALKYASERKQFGKPIASFQGIQFQLSDMATEIEAGKHLMFHAAWLSQNKKPYGKEAAIAKLF